MTLKPLSPRDAQGLMSQGAILVDIRSANEHAREHIAGAQHLPIDALRPGSLPVNAAVIFLCRSGNRTHANAHRLNACVAGDAYLIEGGLNAWKKAGLPVEADTSQPMELQRQVQIATGILILLGIMLGLTVSAWFFLISGFVGAGLVFAGLSGFCGLARLLMKMPWNQRALR